MTKTTLLDLPDDILNKINGYVEMLEKTKQAFTIWKSMSKFRPDSLKQTYKRSEPMKCGYYDSDTEDVYRPNCIRYREPPKIDVTVDDIDYYSSYDFTDNEGDIFGYYSSYDLTDDEIDQYMFGYYLCEAHKLYGDLFTFFKKPTH